MTAKKVDRCVVETKRREQLEQGYAGNQHRKNERRQQHRAERITTGKVGTSKSDGCRYAEQQRSQRRRNREHGAEPQCRQKILVLQRLPVPLNGEAARREDDVLSIRD